MICCSTQAPQEHAPINAPCSVASTLLLRPWARCCCAAADQGRTCCCTGAWLCCLLGPAVIGLTLPPALPPDCTQLLLLPRLLTTSLIAAAKLLSLVDGLAPAACSAVLPHGFAAVSAGLPASASSARAMMASSSSCKAEWSCLSRLFSCFTAISCL
jgi:hypothetical protein